MRFAANLSTLFTEVPLLDRPAAAAQCGIDAVELWWPFPTPVPGDRQVDALVSSLADVGVTMAALSLDAGDLAGGERGLVSLPDAVDRFRANLEAAVGIAERTGCRVLNALYGNPVAGVSAAAQDELAVDNLTLAARAAGTIGTTLVIEALNPFDSPHYPLTRTSQALDLVDLVAAAGAPNVGLLYDAYHMQRSEGNLIATIRRHAARFGHVQIADSPDRHQPGTGEIAYERVLQALEDSGYQGYVGLEYLPLGSTQESFGWLTRMQPVRANDASRKT